MEGASWKLENRRAHSGALENQSTAEVSETRLSEVLVLIGTKDSVPWQLNRDGVSRCCSRTGVTMGALIGNQLILPLLPVFDQDRADGRHPGTWKLGALTGA